MANEAVVEGLLAAVGEGAAAFQEAEKLALATAERLDALEAGVYTRPLVGST